MLHSFILLLDYSIHFMVIEKLQLRLCLCINWNFLSLYGYFSVFLFGFQEKALLAQGSYVLTHELLTYAGSGSS